MMFRSFLIAMTTALFTTTLLAEEEQKPCHPKYQQFVNHTMCLPKSPNARSIKMSDGWRERILAAHNRLRASVQPPATNMMKLRWDDELEEMAQRWTDACEFRHQLEHDIQRFVPGGMFIGQSMSSSTVNFDLAMNFWWLEKQDYTFGRDYQAQKIAGGCGFSVGHYTQIVWAKSYLIGCAATICSNKENVIVCNYGPAGNQLPFKQPYEQGPQCSRCKNCTAEGLCDCGDLHCHGGDLDPATCTCDCMLQADQMVPEFIQEPDCSLNCSGRDLAYCGYPPFDDCKENWTMRKCPHMCKVCPYAEAGYIPVNSSSFTESSENNNTVNDTSSTTDYTIVAANDTLIDDLITSAGNDISGFGTDGIHATNGTSKDINDSILGTNSTSNVSDDSFVTTNGTF